MKCLNVFPLFGRELTNGSEYYEYMITKGLVERGVAVDVFATTASKIRLTSHFVTQWADDYPPGLESADGIRVERFPVDWQIPAGLGRRLSNLILARWHAEEREWGVMELGSHRLSAAYLQRSQTRPWLYDGLARLGLGPWSGAMLARLWRVARQYDVIVVGFMPFTLIAQVAFIARRRGVPLVVLPLFHPEDLYHYSRSLGSSLESAQALLALTTYSAGLFRRLWPNSHPHFVGAGVDLGAFTAPGVSGARFRQRYALTDRKIALFVGRKEYGKRYDLAIAALERLPRDDVTLVMIGADADGVPLTNRRVVHLGHVSRTDLIDAYDACDLLVMPSEQESFGMVLLEAWTRCKPVIGNLRCGAVASLVTHGHDGFLFNNADSLAAHMRNLLDDPGRSSQMGLAGRDLVVREFTWDAVVERVINVLRTVCIGTKRTLSTITK